MFKPLNSLTIPINQAPQTDNASQTNQAMKSGPASQANLIPS
jgi:hypothetical protein